VMMILRILEIYFFRIIFLAIEQLWVSHGWLLMEERLETMYKTKMMNEVVIWLHCCVTKGKEWYWTEEDQNEDDSERFNPYRCSFKKYLEYLQAYAILLPKTTVTSNVRIQRLLYFKHFNTPPITN